VKIVDQFGVSAQVGLAGNSYVEGNLAYLRRHANRKDTPGGMLRFVAPLTDQFALSVQAGLNETLIAPRNSRRIVFGFQSGNFMRPKDYGVENAAGFKPPVPMDIPRVRYEVRTRRVA